MTWALNTEGENTANTRHPKIVIGTINTYDDRMVVAVLKRFEGLATPGGKGASGVFQ